ncbi:MAG: transposase [Lutibacter sp.]|nr:transposase [Lutibacter sp.]
MYKRQETINKIKILIKKYNNKVPLNDIPINNFIQTNSWFDIKESNQFDHINQFKFNKLVDNNKIIKCKKVILIPTIKQKKLLLGWLNSVRIMYNDTIRYIKYRYWNNMKTTTSFISLRKELRSKKLNLIKIYDTPTHILDSGIKLASISYKSAFTNCRNGNIKHFNIRYLKEKKDTHIMGIEQQYFSKNTICVRKLGKKLLNKSNISYDEINKDCKLHYCKLNNKFTLLVPVEQPKYERVENNDYISIDPGVRTFLTGLSNNNHFEICNNMYVESKKILKKIDKSEKYIKDNKKCKNRCRLLRNKLKNKITDLHWKSINYLINQNKNTIIIGKWSTKSCISRKGSLNKMLKRVCSSLRYYDFLQKLDYKSKCHNINLKIQDEAYTSKLCSVCGKINNKLGSSKVFKCTNCNLLYDRDMNSCRNILMRSFE